MRFLLSALRDGEKSIFHVLCLKTTGGGRKSSFFQSRQENYPKRPPPPFFGGGVPRLCHFGNLVRFACAVAPPRTLSLLADGGFRPDTRTSLHLFPRSLCRGFHASCWNAQNSRRSSSWDVPFPLKHSSQCPFLPRFFYLLRGSASSVSLCSSFSPKAHPFHFAFLSAPPPRI